METREAQTESTNFSFPEAEKSILALWNEKEIFKKSGKRISTKQIKEHFEFITPYKEALLKTVKELLHE